MSNLSPLDLLVRKMNSHVALSNEDRSAMRALPHTVRELKASAYLVREGEVLGPCAVLCKGFAFRQKLVEDGSRQIVSLHIPGDALDLQHLFLDCADHNVQALTDVSVALIPRAALREIAINRPTIAHAFNVSNQVEASIFREWVLNVGRRNARKRIAHLLCEVAVRLDERGLANEYGYELPMTQEQLGDASGLTAVHVNRTLMQLEADGLLTRSKRNISFPNWPQLKQVAGFTPLYLHHGQQASAAS